MDFFRTREASALFWDYLRGVLFIYLRRFHSLLVFFAVLVWTIFLFGFTAVVTTLYLTIVSIVIGQRLLLLCDVQEIEPYDFGIRAALGYAILIGVFQLAAFLPINTPGFVLLITLPILIFQREIFRSLSLEALGLLRMPIKLESATCFFVLPLILLLILLVYASYPESLSDALVVHLMIPHQILMHTRWNFDVSNFAFAVMPKGATWLFSAHYLLGRESAVRLLNFLMTGYAAWLIYSAVRRYVDRTAGALLASVFLSAPLTAWVVFVAWEDALLSFLILSATIVLIESWKRPTAGVAFIISLLLSAAVAVKMQGLFAAVPIVFLLLLRVFWLRSVSILKLTLAILPVLFIAAVPYVSAAIITGNPVFPFFNALFKSPYYPHVNFSDARWSGKASTDILYNLTFHSSRFMEGSDGSFGLGHLLLLPGILFTLLWKRQSAILIPTVIAISFGLQLMLFSQYARYFYPTFAVLAIASAAIYLRAIQEGWRYLMILFLLGIIVVNFSLERTLNAFYKFLLPNPFSAEQIIQPAPVSERHLNTIINAKLGRSARALYLLRQHGAGLDGLPLYGNWLNPRLDAALHDVKNESDAVALIKKWGITNVLTGGQFDSSHKAFAKWLPSLARLELRDGDSILWAIDSSLVEAVIAKSNGGSE